LYRRSSSLVANPTSQGLSLHGLGSTGNSRTLVVEDDMPLNDPIGGWIHWQEIPELAIRDVQLVREGASDLYGSSAIGGVINIITARPTSNQIELSSSYGGEDTLDENLLAETKRGPWGVLLASGVIGTNGYNQEAPYQRGPVDQPSNVHSQSALLDVEHERGPLRLFVQGSGYNESRHNGTPYQFNATRLLRYATGADWQTARDSSLTVRLYGSDEEYRQTFSSISNLPTLSNPTCSYRCGETPVKFSFIPDNQLGASAQWNEPLGAGLLLVAGADVYDARIWDSEDSFTGGGSLTNQRDHQRDSGVYGELMWVHKAWTITASSREDWFQNFNDQLLDFTSSGWTPAPAASQPPQLSQHLFDPRLGLSRQISAHWALNASGFRAFREPTPDELYHAFQIGNELTLANDDLLSERATGWEAGVASAHSWGTIRASYFLTQINRPITAVTISPNSSPIKLKRENLGQIESRGVSLDFELKPLSWLAADGGYQYAHAAVSRGPQYLGNWIPEVARNMANLNLRAFKPKLGTFSLQGRLSGRMYDDAANDFLLHSYFRLDAYASHDFGSRFELLAAGENLFNRAIEVSKTPTTTLGQPRVARIGFLIRLGTERQ
jgi:outer membrane receptor protein involved in Fe transport